MSVIRTVIVKVAELFRKEVNEISIFMRFDEDLSADSIDLAELVMWAEDEFDLELMPEKVEDIKTISGMVDFIETAQAKKEKLKKS